MNRLVTATALSLMLATAAITLARTTLAQQSGMPGSKPSPLAVNATSAGQHGNELRASKLIGTTVQNNTNEPIGKINEIILSKDGKVAGVVIGVGGFLGMGEREIAVTFEALRIAQDSHNMTTVSLNATKDGLRAAPEWQWIGDRSGTTGNSSAPTQQPVSR